MEKKSKKSAIIGVTCLLLVTLILLGLTYAYYRTRIIGNENTTISVTSKKLELTYQDGSANIEASGIEPSDTVYTKTFSVKNTGSVELTYSVYLIDVVNTFERKDDIKYTLVCSAGCSGKDETTFPSEDSQLVTNTIASGVTHTYTLSFTYKDNGDQSVDMGKELSAKIQILEATTEDEDDVILFGTGILAENVLNNVKNGDLEGKSSFVANLNATNMVENRVTADDKILSTATDDYGTTYYFRGNVIDNYVNYAGMCWRIVRIQGDGSIKLILASELECSETNVKSDSGFATIAVQGVNYGYKIQNGNYIPDYINAPEENEESARTNLNAWLNTKITSEEQTLLKDEQWCIGDLTNAYDDEGEIIGNIDDFIVNTTDGGVDGKWFMYIASVKDYQTKTPSFICETTGKTGEIDTNKIGMLTYDEAVYAGGSSTSNYLYKNASTSYWWMLSPSQYTVGSEQNYGISTVYTMDYSGTFSAESVDSSFHLRPVVSLKSGVEITGGKGTINDPYEIKVGSQTKFVEYIKSTGLQSEEHPYEKYITYASGYTFDENTGTFSLEDPITEDRDSATPMRYDEDTRRVFLATTTVQDDDTPIPTTGLTEIYEVTRDLGSSGVEYNVISSREE